MDLGVLILRVAIGLLFVGHGTQKLFGWFGGYGLDGTAGFMGSLGFRKPRVAALSAGVFEVGAGVFLAAGLLTPFAAAAIIGVMINAIVSVKGRALLGGYELDAVYAAGALALAFTGAGRYSVDDAVGWGLGGATWGLVSLGLAVVIGAAVLASRTRPEPAAEEARTEPLAA